MPWMDSQYHDPAATVTAASWLQVLWSAGPLQLHDGNSKESLKVHTHVTGWVAVSNESQEVQRGPEHVMNLVAGMPFLQLFLTSLDC